MHDFHAANKILHQALEYAQKSHLKKITKIVIELGEIKEHGAIIAPLNLKFNLNLLNQKTIAKGAEIQIEKIKGDYFKLKEIQGMK
ncbi:MAG: hydrogenase/urease maturation nickel metallochaperone HypA [Candidatus Doudnabacteria bacterium]